jgi:sterol O-acyltransferase
MSKKNATILTFLLSALLHELVIVVSGGRIRGYFFILQMLQIPLTAILRMPLLRKNPLIGNAFFWFGMYLGQPILAVAYLREQYSK